MAGTMSLGRHVILKFPDKPGSGKISTSRFIHGQTLKVPEEKVVSQLKPGAAFDDLAQVPTIDGSATDLSIYPARRGYDDIATIVNDPAADFAWTAATFADQGYLWYALKDPRVLRDTVFWSSNGGRFHAPWNGRHINVMGIADVASIVLNPKTPLHINYIMGVAPIPKDFDKVAGIERSPDNMSIAITSSNGIEITSPVDSDFLYSE
jgi:hypothetical protein